MSKSVNTIMLESDDKLIIEAVREKVRWGWNLERIAKFYNIFVKDNRHTNQDWGIIPDVLYKVLGRVK